MVAQRWKENIGDSKKAFHVAWPSSEATLPSHGIVNYKETAAVQPYKTRFNFALTDLTHKVNEHDRILGDLQSKPNIIATRIYYLPSEKYELISPIDAILEIYEDEVLALIPELTLYGEGKNDIDALNDLKEEFIDLLDMLEDTSEVNLGQKPKMWKKSLKLMVRKCQ